MTTFLVDPAGTTPEPSPHGPLALSGAQAGAGTWLKAVLFTLLAWAVLVCSGLGGTVGVASPSLANKLAANAQHLQRHGIASLASRAVRRDREAATSVQEIAGVPQAQARDFTDAAQPVSELGLQIGARQTDEPPLSPTEPRLKPRHRAHPSRAPPVLA